MPSHRILSFGLGLDTHFEENLTLPSFSPATAAATTAGHGLVVAVVAVVQVAVVAVAAVAPACRNNQL